jgi:hypothetical protein
MSKLIAILVLAYMQASCAAMNSYATAVRDLEGTRDGQFYCWRRGLGNGEGHCTELGLDKDLWSCARKLLTIGNAFQSTRRSRDDLIDCMHEKDWQEFAVVVTS